MQKQRTCVEDGTQTVQLSEVATAKLGRDVLSSIPEGSHASAVRGWVTAEQQYYREGAHHTSHHRSPRAQRHGGAPAPPITSPQLRAAPATLPSLPSGPVLRVAAVAAAGGSATRRSHWSPARGIREHLGRNEPLSRTSSSSSSFEVKNDDADVSLDGDAFSPRMLPDVGENDSSLFGTSRPVTPSFVEARGRRLPRSQQGEFTLKQTLFILMFVVCAFVYVSYPMDTAEELREIQILMANENQQKGGGTKTAPPGQVPTLSGKDADSGHSLKKASTHLQSGSSAGHRSSLTGVTASSDGSVRARASSSGTRTRKEGGKTVS